MMRSRFMQSMFFLCLIIFAGMFWGCGDDLTSKLSSPDMSRDISININEPTGDVAFLQWCQNWELDCPTGEPENVPYSQDPWTAEQWKAAVAIHKALLESSSDLAVLRTELDDPLLLRVMRRLKVENEFNSLKARLDVSKFTAVSGKQGKMIVNTAEPTDFIAPSRLVIHNDKEINLSVNAQFDLVINGVALKSQGGTSDGLKGISITNKNVMNMIGVNQTVADVPIKYSFHDFLGIDFSSSEQIEPPQYNDIVPVLVPVRDWLIKGKRDLDLKKVTISEITKNLIVLMPNVDQISMMTRIMNKTERIYSTAGSRGKVLFSLDAVQPFECILNNKISLTFNQQFGLESLSKLSESTATLTLFGVKAKPMTGPFQPTFDLRRIDLLKDKIVVQDVPIIGSYEIDVNNSSEPTTLSCE